jgi:hypothetical protein
MEPEPNELPPRKKRCATLRRNRKTIIDGLTATDTVCAVFDDEDHEWRLLIETDGEITIRHERLENG